ncbi:hypothetical protein RB195_000773 [Necator americanus]|uniref:Reverse transcriptase domain-containing protein n=1 Tax=Necator americanus TaxID=51031 RepID=A0ABR1DCM4_NECAM
MSVGRRTAPGPDRIRSEHLKNLLKKWKTSKTVLLYKKGDPHDISNYRPICLLSVIYKLFISEILNRIEKS